MQTFNTSYQTSAFPLSMAIVNTDAGSPLLFLHLNIDPNSKMVKGDCELINPSVSNSYSSKTELSGEYRSMDMVHQENGYVVHLLGYPSYDQNCPIIKITLSTDYAWKKGKVFYEYFVEGQWLKMNNLNLRIKLVQSAMLLSNLQLS